MADMGPGLRPAFAGKTRRGSSNAFKHYANDSVIAE